MMKKNLILLCLFLFLPAQATTWVQYDNKKYIDKDSLQYYVDDRGYIKYNQKTFWTKSLNDNSKYFKEIEKITKKKIWYILDKQIVDYGNDTLTYKSSAFYDIKGELAYSFTNEDFQLKWHSIVPDSNGAFVYELVRHPKFLKKLYKMQRAERLKTVQRPN